MPEWSESINNRSMMGQYMTRIEGELIDRAFDDLGWPKLVLDIGGGDGRLSRPLQARGVSPVILEHDILPLKLLKDENWQWPLIMGDGNLLPVKSKSLDAVLTFHVAVCTDAQHNAHFFSEVYRVLKESGIFLAVTDNRNSPLGALSRMGGRPGLVRKPYQFYSEAYAATRDKLADAGFRISRVKGFRWIPFSRTSNSPLIPVFSAIERLLGLHDLVAYSPWLFWAAVK